MAKRKISSLEYKLAQILNIQETLESCEPRSRLEEEQASNDSLREQLSTFKNSDGSPIDSNVVDYLAGKAH